MNNESMSETVGTATVEPARQVLVGEQPAETVWVGHSYDDLSNFLAGVLKVTGAKKVVATVQVEMKEQK